MLECSRGYHDGMRVFGKKLRVLLGTPRRPKSRERLLHCLENGEKILGRIESAPDDDANVEDTDRSPGEELISAPTPIGSPTAP